MNKINDKDLACKCCGVVKINEVFKANLEAAQTFAKIPFKFSSGYRCEDHNKKEGGSPTSSHLKGLAADIKVENSRQRYRILFGLIMAGFTRVGIGRGFVHVDQDQDKDQEVGWTYYKKGK